MNESKNSARKKGWTIFFILVVIGIITTLLAPSEIILGDTAKLVYLHGALVWVSLILFGIIGAIGVIQLTTKHTRNTLYLLAFEEVATVFWLTSTALGFLVAYLAWGGIFWNEPRIIMAIIISILALVTYYLSTEYNNWTRNSILAIVQISIISILVIETGRIFHPENSIAQSGFSIQLVFTILVIVFLGVAVQVVRLRLPSKISYHVT